MAAHNDSTPGTPNSNGNETAENRSSESVGDMFAQKVSTITVPAPDANKVITIKVEAGRTLQLKFNNPDVVKREVVDDDLVLLFKNGGKVVLQDYMEAFGLMADIPTKVVQADGKSFLLPDLLDVASGPGKPSTPSGRSDTADVVSTPITVDRPGEGQDKVVTMRFGRGVKFNFNSGDVATSKLDSDGNLTLSFNDGGSIKLVGWQAVAAKASLTAIFNDKSIALIELPNTAAGDDLALDGTNNFGAADIGAIGPGIDHLGPLGNELLRFGTVDPDPTIFGTPGPRTPPPPGANPPVVLRSSPLLPRGSSRDTGCCKVIAGRSRGWSASWHISSIVACAALHRPSSAER